MALLNSMRSTAVNINFGYQNQSGSQGKVKRKPVESLGLFVGLRTKQRNETISAM